MTVAEVLDRETACLERFARQPWFGFVAPPELQSGLGGAPDLRARDAVRAFFAQGDLGTLRAAVDHVRALEDAWIVAPDDQDYTAPPPLHREAAAVRGCLSRLEHALASLLLQEARS